MNYLEFENQIVRKFAQSRAPLRGNLELTGRCNFNCKMCYVHTKSNTEFLKTERDGQWWKAQIDEACNRGMLFALLTGGECLMHPDFREIYLHLRNKGVYTHINTNGFLLNKNNIDFLSHNRPLTIQITLYGSDDDSYEKVTGVRAFKHVDNAISAALDAGLNIRVAITPNAYTPDETEKIIAYVKKRQLSYMINEAMFTPYNQEGVQKISNFELSVEDKIRYFRAIKEQPMFESESVVLPKIGGDAHEPVYGLRCSAGTTSFSLTADGYMQPCYSMYHLRVPIATAADFGPAWEQIRKVSSEYLTPIECEGCAYRKACLSCPVARGGKVGNGHCDPAVCEMTRKLVAAGVKKLEQTEQSCE